MKSTQNLSPGRFRHAEAESEVKNLQNFQPDLEISISYFLLSLLISYYSFFSGGSLQNFHPDLEMKENDLQIFFLLIRSSGYLNREFPINPFLGR